MAARMRLTLERFDHGTELNDLDLHVVEAPDDPGYEVTESLRWDNQPGDSWLLKRVNIHRVTSTGAPTHAFDVTEVVAAALALKKSSISFMMKRRREISGLSQVAFYSREASSSSGESRHPVLELLTSS